MPIRQIITSGLLAAGIATLPLSPASAQYYAPCPGFPLTLPFCVAGAAVGAAATIATAPFRAIGGPYYYYGYPYYYGPYYGYGSYYGPAYYRTWHHRRRHHYPR